VDALALTIMLLVTSSNPCKTILTIRISFRPRASSNTAYITSPTGKTKPPIILTSPGFVAPIPADPPEMISERSPPNDSITPASTYVIDTLAQFQMSDMAQLTALYKTRSSLVRCFATALATIAAATSAGLSVLGGSMLAIISSDYFRLFSAAGTMLRTAAAKRRRRDSKTGGRWGQSRDEWVMYLGMLPADPGKPTKLGANSV
jgi:hypothetical protein